MLPTGCKPETTKDKVVFSEIKISVSRLLVELTSKKTDDSVPGATKPEVTTKLISFVSKPSKEIVSVSSSIQSPRYLISKISGPFPVLVIDNLTSSLTFPSKVIVLLVDIDTPNV